MEYIDMENADMESSMKNEKLKLIPERPGVYLMKDSLGNIIYVGKGKNLKNRVSQYFYKQKDREPKVEEMIQNIRDFEYRVLDTELDALLEECRLIKEIKPLYNRQMKNDQKYVYLKIPGEEFPKLEIVQEREDDGAYDGALYYGPFNSRHQVERAVEFFNDHFLLRKCTTPRFKEGRGCLYRELGTCLGVCTGKISQEEYMVQVQALCQVIEGNDKSVNRELKCQLEKEIEELNFEKASSYRQYLLGVTYIQGRQKFLRSTRRNKSVLLFEYLDEDKTRAKIFLTRGNKLLMSKVINKNTPQVMKPANMITLSKKDQKDGPSNTGSSDNTPPDWLPPIIELTNSEMFEFLKAAQKRLLSELLEDKRSPWQLTQQEVDEAQIIYSYLHKKEGVFTFPVTKKLLREEDFPEYINHFKQNKSLK